jgi:hypothetical protein
MEHEEDLYITLPLDDNIMNPVTGLEKLFEQTVSHQGKWRIHKSDPDNIFPSDPHADRVDASEKLNLFTGDVYDTKKKYLYALSKKAMQFIYYKILNKGEETIIQKLQTNLSKIIYL